LDFKLIKQIVELMKRSGLTEFEVEEEGLKIRICRKNGVDTPQIFTTATSPPYPVISSELGQKEIVTQNEQKGAETQEDKNIIFIDSPMVGTFYRSPTPDSPPFIEVGAEVNTQTIVCIVEAMKVMNEIQAEVKGKVIEILVENGATVDYGQPIFKLKKA